MGRPLKQQHGDVGSRSSSSRRGSSLIAARFYPDKRRRHHPGRVLLRHRLSTSAVVVDDLPQGQALLQACRLGDVPLRHSPDDLLHRPAVRRRLSTCSSSLTQPQCGSRSPCHSLRLYSCWYSFGTPSERTPCPRTSGSLPAPSS